LPEEAQGDGLRLAEGAGCAAGAAGVESFDKAARRLFSVLRVG